MPRSVRGNNILHRQKGWMDFTPPGYNWCGPGNKDDNAPALNPTDALCRDHDRAYTNYLKHGMNPYTHFFKPSKNT